MKADLVQRLRERAYAFKAPDPLVEEAADEIERLRLTPEERAAIKVAVSDYEDNDMDAGCWQIANTLRGILARQPASFSDTEHDKSQPLPVPDAAPYGVYQRQAR